MTDFDEVYPDVIFDDEPVDPGDGLEDDDTMRFVTRRYLIRTPVLRYGDLDRSGPTLITEAAPKRVQAVVYEFARYFRREFHYDFPQFHDPTLPASVNDALPPWEAWIWSPANSLRPIAIGATVFRHERVVGNEHPEWVMSWIWLHPYFRRRGLLTQAWPTFRHRYGDQFLLEHPLSAAMEAFVQSQGHSAGGRPESR
jgi:hypothetical protein